MKAVYVYNGHEIALIRNINSTVLTIDGIETEKKEGLFKHDASASYSGTIKGTDGHEDKVEVTFKPGFPKEIKNTVKFFINDQLMFETEVL